MPKSFKGKTNFCFFIIKKTEHKAMKINMIVSQAFFLGFLAGSRN